MPEVPKSEIVRMYGLLLKLRRMEERVLRFVYDGVIPGMFHSYLGEEAIAVGVVSQLRQTDIIAVTHRGRGHAMVKGVDPKRIFAEVLGRRDGICKGKGGEIHVADPAVGVLGASGIVGGMLSISLGAAFAAQYNGSDHVTVSFFGDGASNQGTFHECLNLASIWKMPIVFVCHNNGWAEYSPQRATTPVRHISERAAAYAMPGNTVDGDDVLAVYEAAGVAISRARKGEGPTLLECMTHRWLGHHVGDQQKYRSREELEECRASDPLARFTRYVLEHNILTQSEIDGVEKEIAAEIAEAVAYADASPVPKEKDLYEDVYK